MAKASFADAEGGEDLTQYVFHTDGACHPRQGFGCAPQIIPRHFRGDIQRDTTRLDGGERLTETKAVPFTGDGGEIGTGKITGQPAGDPVMQSGKSPAGRRADTQDVIAEIVVAKIAFGRDDQVAGADVIGGGPGWIARRARARRTPSASTGSSLSRRPAVSDRVTA